MRNINNFLVHVDNIPMFLEPQSAFAFRMQRKVNQIMVGNFILVEGRRIQRVRYTTEFNKYQLVRDTDFMDYLYRFAAGEMANELLKNKLIASRVYDGQTDENKILELSLLAISPK